MNKTKMILAGTGGAIGLVVLVLAFLVWQALSAKTAAIEGDDEEGIDGLETVEARAQNLSHKSIYPCKESLAALEANQSLVEDWGKDSLSHAARGDKTFDATTPAAFKTFLVADARRIAALPGAAAGKLVKPDFAFGPFKDYIAEGKMPAEADLADLQRKWDDVATVAETLSRSGIAELIDVQFAETKKSEGDEEERASRSKKGRKGKQKESSAPLAAPVSHSYVFTFSARPPAFVRTVNALTDSERFVTVDGFSFGRPEDAVAAALGGDEKREGAATASARRARRARRGNSDAFLRSSDGNEVSAAKNGIVTDPLADAPLKVVMTVSVHDFRSLEKPSDDEEKGASK